MSHSTPEVVAVEAELRQLARSTSAEERLVKRARIVVARVYDGLGSVRTSEKLGIPRQTIAKWVRRFLANPGVEALHDDPRSGRPATYGDRDHALILTLACQRPEDVGRLEATMTQAVISEEAAKRGVPVSRSTVQRTLAAAEVRPHKEQYYLFTDKSDPEYEPRRDAICDLYTQPLPADEVVVCFDEQTGLQALGLPAALPHGGRRTAAPGKPALVEHQYVRYGSRTLSAIVRPCDGQLVCAELFPARGYDTSCAIAMLQSLLHELPAARYRRIHIVMDNGSTHRSKAMQEFLASPEAERLHAVYTPVHASWLNLAENFLSRFYRRYLARKRYDSLDSFDEHVYACIEDYARVARPMRWAYNPKRNERSAS
jgi:transposase